MFKFPHVVPIVRPLYTPAPSPPGHVQKTDTWCEPPGPPGSTSVTIRSHVTLHDGPQGSPTMYAPVSDAAPARLTDEESSKDLKNQDNRTILENLDNNPEAPPRRHKPQKHRTPANVAEPVTGNGYGDTRDHRVDLEDVNRLSIEERNYKNRFHSVGVQVCPATPYRLRVIPRTRRSKSDPEKCECARDRLSRCCTIAGRWALSQCGLTLILLVWALLGAAAFHETEGPREREQAEELSTLQYHLAVSLATELRQVLVHEPVWLSMVKNYFAKHETLLLNAVSSGYGEGGGGGHIWTYPGCVLFAVSLLTTLGFGAPVPRTTLGRGAAVLFSAIGIPLHFLLILNVGMLFATKLQKFAMHRYNEQTSSPRTFAYLKQPEWLKWFPFAAIACYYSLGVILFGLVRQRDFTDCLLFPLDFTATGGVAKTSGQIRIFYALYLEFAVILAATTVALLQVSATQGITNLGLRLGLLTNT